jgi:hypothetical protein
MSTKGFTNGGSGVGSLLQGIGENALSQVSGIVSTKPQAKYTSGARTTLKINNKLAGFAFSVSWKITTESTEIRTIDDYFPYELVPNRIMVEGTIGAFHIPGQSVTQEFIQANALSFLFHKYITIEVRDSATDQVLFKTNNAVITSRSEDLTAEQLGKIQLTWRAIGWQDELSPADSIYKTSIDADGIDADGIYKANLDAD